jgi:hypothetical protein
MHVWVDGWFIGLRHLLRLLPQLRDDGLHELEFLELLL